MKKNINFEQKKRNQYLKNELNKLKYKFLIKSTVFSLNTIYKYFNLTHNLNKFNKKQIPLHNFCYLSYNVNSLHKNVKLSRWKFKHNQAYGNLIGWRKSSW